MESGKLHSPRAAYTRILAADDPEPPVFDWRSPPANYDEVARGIEGDRELRAALQFYKLGIRLWGLDGPGDRNLTSRPALVQFGLAVEAIGYRLARTGGFGRRNGQNRQSLSRGVSQG